MRQPKNRFSNQVKKGEQKSNSPQGEEDGRLMPNKVQRTIRWKKNTEQALFMLSRAI